MAIGITANLWFAIASMIFVAIVVTLVADRITAKSLGKYDGDMVSAADEDVPEGEARGLRFAGIGTLIALAVVVLLTVLPDAPLRNPETGAFFEDSPLMDSLIFIITMLFLVAGVCFGIGAKTFKESADVIRGIEKQPYRPFQYNNLGNMATIGRNSAVGDFGWMRIRGYIGWLAWLFVHILNLIGFRNRLVVLVQWAWSYFSYQRAIRLITGDPPSPS